ncbi:MAG: hypothetical protein ACPIOQ_25865 [Promethearchaeia archaeon]
MSKTKTIQQMENEKNMLSPEENAMLQNNQLFQQPQNRFGGFEEKRAFRRGHRGAAPFKNDVGARAPSKPAANQNFNRYFRQSNIMPTTGAFQPPAGGPAGGGGHNKQSASRTRRPMRDLKSPGMSGSEVRSAIQ